MEKVYCIKKHWVGYKVGQLYDVVSKAPYPYKKDVILYKIRKSANKKGIAIVCDFYKGKIYTESMQFDNYFKIPSEYRKDRITNLNI